MNIDKVIKIESYTLINYTELSLKRREKILEYRNHDSVRKWMIDDSIISLEDHLSFIDNLRNDNSKHYYAVVKEDNILGCIYITDWNNNSKTCEWGCFLNPKFFGLGLKLGYIFVNLIFIYFKAIKIYANVCVENVGAIQLNTVLGFKELSNKNNIIHYELESVFWNVIPESYRLFIKKIKKTLKK